MAAMAELPLSAGCGDAKPWRSTVDTHLSGREPRKGPATPPGQRAEVLSERCPECHEATGFDVTDITSEDGARASPSGLLREAFG